MPSNEQKDEQPVPSYRAMLVGNRTEFIDFSSDRCAPFHDEPGIFTNSIRQIDFPSVVVGDQPVRFTLSGIVYGAHIPS
jgi:hypothetical protein